MSREQVLIKFANHYLSICFHANARIRLIYDNYASCTYLDSRRKDAETISEILLRAASEPEFRNQLVKEPAKILEQYNISAEAKLLIKTSIADLTQ